MFKQKVNEIEYDIIALDVTERLNVLSLYANNTSIQNVTFDNVKKESSSATTVPSNTLSSPETPQESVSAKIYQPEFDYMEESDIENESDYNYSSDEEGDDPENEKPEPDLIFYSTIAAKAKPSAASDGGDDAVFKTKKCLGVFDGVGGSRENGVDPSLFSSTLASLTHDNIEILGPGKCALALQNAEKDINLPGSSTALVVGLDGVRLKGLQVGDSVIMVIRDDRVVMRTHPEQHYFNCPKQIFRGSDSAKTGMYIDFKVRPGDILVLGTDGLWDNAFDEQIKCVVRKFLMHHYDRKRKRFHSDENLSHSDAASTRLRQLAKLLVHVAFRQSMESDYETPFSFDARAHGFDLPGGKPDDITVILAEVHENKK